MAREGWSGDGQQLSVAVVRIAIGLSTAWSLLLLVADPGPRASYEPDGLWQLFGTAPPPAAVITALRGLCWISTVFMIVGFRARLSSAVSAVSFVCLCSYEVGFYAGWTRVFNVVQLVHLAFLGARSGDTLAVDAWLRARAGLPPAVGHYRWSIQLVQLATALMFASAAAAKWAAGGFTASWIFSDNMRHQILVQYDLLGIPRSAVANAIVDNVVLYRGAALCAVVCQLVPLASVFLLRYPRARLVCAACFVAEAVGIGLVLDLWDPHWLPLACVFVDWEWLTRRPRTATPPRAPRRAMRAFASVYVAVYIATAFTPGLDRWLSTYPFTRFPMFAHVRAKRPYDVHQSYELVRGRLEIAATPALSDDIRAWVTRSYGYRWLHRIRDPRRLRTRLAQISRDVERRCACRVDAVVLELAVLRSPAYPAPAGLEERRYGVIGELARDGTYRTALGTSTRDGDTRVVRVAAHGLDLASAQLVYAAGDAQPPRDVAATRTAQTFRATLPATDEPETFLLDAGGRRWVIERTGPTW